MPQSGSRPPASPATDRKDHRASDPLARRIWDYVSHSELRSLWNCEGTPAKVVLKRTAKAFMDDDLLSRAAELGFYFLFALFPTLICVSSVLGLAARSGSIVYDGLLQSVTIVVPPSAYQLVIDTFNQTAQASSGGKAVLGFLVALWSASVGFAAIQDTLNLVYKVRETRPYWKSRGSAVLVTILLAAIATLSFGVMFAGGLAGARVYHHIWHRPLRISTMIGIHVVIGLIVFALWMLIFSTIYYYAPNLQKKTWRWLTPGAAFGIITWMLASIGLRVYLHFFNTYSVTYGSLGAVIILLTWFYITGLTLLTGAELNSEIQASVAERQLAASGVLSPDTVDSIRI
jgi:membrane protein